jgi:hypothetical protein
MKNIPHPAPRRTVIFAQFAAMTSLYPAGVTDATPRRAARGRAAANRADDKLVTIDGECPVDGINPVAEPF